MPLRAGFAEVDITPPPGTHKIGWIRLVIGTKVADPLFARVAVFEDDGRRVAFVQLDTLSIRWTTTNDIRQRVRERYGFPGENVMVTATHNHAGPAVSTGDGGREDAYVETMTRKIVDAFGRALESMEDAEIGFGGAYDFGLAHNRRVVMRDGTAVTGGNPFGAADALYVEGPIDPIVTVVGVRRCGGELLGALVNFTCHPTHHGGDEYFSAGYPGVLAAMMKLRRCPVTMFLNGACGNVGLHDNRRFAPTKSMSETGLILADHAERLLGEMEFTDTLALGGRSATLQLDFRTVTEDEIRGTVNVAQRFVDPKLYDKHIPGIVEKIRERKTQPAEVQVLFLGEHCVVGVPAEYFVEFGLRIKEEGYPRRPIVAAHTNGMIGYVPTRAAFRRGGYETTFGYPSKMAPDTGDRIADCAIELIRSGCPG